MMKSNRRNVLTSLSALWLSACGGGGGAESADATTDQGIDSGDSRDATPTPAPPAPAPPAPAPPPPPVASVPDSSQFRTWDAGSGPARDFWSKHLHLPWKNPATGDWVDADGTAQGDAPFSSTPISAAPAWYPFDGTVLVKRWLTAGENKGYFLRASGKSSPAITWSGRSSANPPRLVVTMSDKRIIECACQAFSSFAESSQSGLDTRVQNKTTTVQRSILQFDLSAVKGTVSKAVVHLYCEKISGLPVLDTYECDPPRFQLGAGQAKPVMGLAAQVGESALSSHADVLRAGDFADLTKGALFDTIELSENSSNEQLPDPDAPGTTMFRGSFTPQGRGSFSGRIEAMRANYDDPLRPPAVVEEEMFCRLYFYLEDDWRSTRDANKMAIGWDLRLGWWNNAQGGYWQSTTGNGGAKGTGLKVFAPAKSNGGSQSYDCWEYQGHSVRLEAGLGVNDGNPYESMRPVQSYVYNLDQPTGFGEMFRLGAAVIQRGRWHCIEQQVKMNSITGPFDANGNGQAVADGVLRTWLDGVLVSEVTTLRWRRHPEMGVQGPWINWFYGGKQASEMTMHYRMNHLVVARRYIGPRVG